MGSYVLTMRRNGGGAVPETTGVTRAAAAKLRSNAARYIPRSTGAPLALVASSLAGAAVARSAPVPRVRPVEAADVSATAPDSVDGDRAGAGRPVTEVSRTSSGCQLTPGSRAAESIADKRVGTAESTGSRISAANPAPPRPRPRPLPRPRPRSLPLSSAMIWWTAPCTDTASNQ